MAVFIIYHHFHFFISLIIYRLGAIVGVIGPNGAGKSTLIKMIMGKEKADSGTFTVGETVKLAVVDQVRSSILFFILLLIIILQHNTSYYNTLFSIIFNHSTMISCTLLYCAFILFSCFIFYIIFYCITIYCIIL